MNCKSGISFNDFLYFGNDFFTRCRFWPTWFRCIFDGLYTRLTSTHNLCFEQKYEKYLKFLPENFQFLVVKFSVYLNRHVFVMKNDLTDAKFTKFRDINGTYVYHLYVLSTLVPESVNEIMMHHFNSNILEVILFFKLHVVETKCSPFIYYDSVTKTLLNIDSPIEGRTTINIPLLLLGFVRREHWCILTAPLYFHG